MDITEHVTSEDVSIWLEVWNDMDCPYTLKEFIAHMYERGWKQGYQDAKDGN